MSALSDYLESGLLHHVFANQPFTMPSSVALALLSNPATDISTGSSISEIPSGVGSDITGYSRVNITSLQDAWRFASSADNVSFAVSGTRSNAGTGSGVTGNFYPVYLTQARAGGSTSEIVTFTQFPNTTFYFASGNNNVYGSGSSIGSNTSYNTYPTPSRYLVNKYQIIFPTALNDWGFVSGVAILDDANYKSGNVLMYSTLTNPRLVYGGDNIRFDAESLQIVFN
jgi:hypothetical protein